MGKTRRCDTCRFFYKANRCRRYPPIMILDQARGAVTSDFPVTKSAWLCGEWKFKLVGVKLEDEKRDDL